MKPVLVIKALPKHWSNYFDTIQDAQQALLQSGGVRTMSMDDAQNVESVPTRPGNVIFELGLTADGAKSIMPGIARGEIFDQQLLDEGGLFSYRPLLQSFRPGLETYHPDFPPTLRLPLKIPDLPSYTNRPQVLVGTLENPKFHATSEQGRLQTEGFLPVGFDPKQTFLLSDPKKPFNRRNIPEAVMRIALGETKDYAPGTMGYDTETGRAIQAFSALPLTPQDPMYEQDDAWGKPRTVDDEFRLSEPMHIAFQLLKQSLELQPPMTQGVEEEQPIEEEMPMQEISMDDYETPCECAERVRNAALETILDMTKRHGLDFTNEYQKWQGYSCQEILQFVEDNSEAVKNSFGIVCDNGGISEADQMKYAGEPMDIALQLLKERVSPEAKRHKLEYDKKYESTPERVKYREELNRERRRRGIYGSHDHKDISHTEGGKLTLEGEHENRARHFKDKGTLRELNKAQQTLPSYDKSQVESLVKPDQSTMYISSRPGREKVSAEEQSQKHDALLAAIAELNKNKQMNIMTGVGEGEWGKEHSIAIQNYPPEVKEKLYALARQFGQDAVAESNAREKGMRFVNPATREDTFSFGGREIQEEPRYSTNFPTGQKITFTE